MQIQNHKQSFQGEEWKDNECSATIHELWRVLNPLQLTDFSAAYKKIQLNVTSLGSLMSATHIVNDCYLQVYLTVPLV